MLWKKKNIDTRPSGASNSIRWGDLFLPHSEGPGHFLAVGATGSGKSSILRLLGQSVFPQVGKGDCRALYYDAKQDAMSVLSAIVPTERVLLLNPFDERGHAWDMCSDIRELRVAIEFAFTLIPAVNESQPFFSDAARALMIGVLKTFLLSGDEWTFGDLLRPLHNLRQLKALLKKHNHTRDLIDLYLRNAKLAGDIMSTMGTKLVRFEPIAGCWEHADRKISIQEWIRGEQILVLGNSEISRTALDAINRCIVKRACDLTLNLSESPTRRVWFFFDELSEAGKLDGIVSLLKKGRSKGAAIVLAFQSTSGLRDGTMYGQYFTDEIVGQIGNRFFGRLECPVTAEWTSQIVGDQEATVTSTSFTRASQGGSSTTNYQDQIRRAVLPSEFLDMKPCNRENGLTGLFLVRSVGTFFANIPGDRLFDKEIIPANESVPHFLPRPFQHQFLEPWTEEQAKRFGVPFRKRRDRGPEGGLEDLFQ